MIKLSSFLLTITLHTYKAISLLKPLGYLGHILHYDGRKALAKVQTPLYLVFGENDDVVPIKKNITIAEQILANSDLPYKIHTVPKTNHAFATAEFLQSWDEIESKASPYYIETLIDFCNWTKTL